jgi:hypothetical protein
MSMDLAYFPVVTNVVGSNDSFATFSFSAQSSQVSQHQLALAWAILRARHPVLASVGLVDAAGKVSFSYQSPFTTSYALVDAETSLEHRQDSSTSDLVSSYLAGTRRVSRSHLSHLYFSTSPPGSPVFSKPLTPPISEHDRRLPNPDETLYTFLLCTPHYVADSTKLYSYLEELVSLLTTHPFLSENDLQAEINRAQNKSCTPHPQLSGIAVASRTPVSPIQMKLSLTGRFQRATIVTAEVACQ